MIIHTARREYPVQNDLPAVLPGSDVLLTGHDAASYVHFIPVENIIFNRLRRSDQA
ncbi:MAG: hypothetical protein IKB16_01685 [Lentisphaeria bacterium]|nr:hypothetical protein [Lentisphaeria bacterium]